MSIDAMKQALAALRFALHVGFDESSESQIKKGDKAVQQHQAAITTLRTAIEQAEKQEPVAWVKHLKEMVVFWQYDKDCPAKIMEELKRIELTAPPQRQPLTDEEAWRIFEEARNGSVKPAGVLRGIRAIERAHGITGEKE